MGFSEDLEYNRTEHNSSVRRTYTDHQVQPCDRFRANQELQRVNEGIVQVPVEHWQAWGINHLSEKPVTVFDCPHGNKMFPNVWSKPPLAQLCAIPSCPASVPREKRPAPPSSSPTEEVAESHEVASQPPFLQSGQPKCTQHVPSSPCTSFEPYTGCFQVLNIRFLSGNPKLHTIFKVRPHQH